MSSESMFPNESARHIARVAARLFAAHGYDATSVRTIVEAAGVTKPTLYYHYGSKEGLAQALVSRPSAVLVETLKRIAETEGDPVAALEQFFEAHFGFFRDDPDRARFMFALFFGPLASELASELNNCSDSMKELLNDSVNRLANAGLIDPERADDCVRACRGMIVIATMDFLYHNAELGPGMAPRLVNDLLRGFAAGGGSKGVRGEA